MLKLFREMLILGYWSVTTPCTVFVILFIVSNKSAQRVQTEMIFFFILCCVWASQSRKRTDFIWWLVMFRALCHRLAPVDLMMNWDGGVCFHRGEGEDGWITITALMAWLILSLHILHNLNVLYYRVFSLVPCLQELTFTGKEIGQIGKAFHISIITAGRRR